MYTNYKKLIGNNIIYATVVIMKRDSILHIISVLAYHSLT